MLCLHLGKDNIYFKILICNELVLTLVFQVTINIIQLFSQVIAIIRILC